MNNNTEITSKVRVIGLAIARGKVEAQAVELTKRSALIKKRGGQNE